MWTLQGFSWPSGVNLRFLGSHSGSVSVDFVFRVNMDEFLSTNVLFFFDFEDEAYDWVSYTPRPQSVDI